MKKKLIILGFLLCIAALFMISSYALHMTQGILTSFADGEQHFKAIATAATEASSYAKRAESHLLLYLALHQPADREKYPERITSLNKQLRILDQQIQHPDARVILETIQGTTGHLLADGTVLIAAHDAAMAQTGAFDITAWQEAIQQLHDQFALIREMGVQLSMFEIHLESDLELAAIQHAMRLRIFLIGLMILAFGFTVYLGVVLTRMVYTIQTESRQREEALAKVKVLSGLLPICMSCKKIRDDQGYWNQIEGYIHAHSDAEFSHGLCPVCMKEQYPEYCDKAALESTADESDPIQP